MTIYVVEYKADTDVPFYPVDGDANSHIIYENPELLKGVNNA